MLTFILTAPHLRRTVCAVRSTTEPNIVVLHILTVFENQVSKLYLEMEAPNTPTDDDIINLVRERYINHLGSLYSGS